MITEKYFDIMNKRERIMTQETTKRPDTTTANFIIKLTDILANPTHSKAVIWRDDGNGFIILDHQKFTSKVLPSYYRHRNMSSFIRQLNMYGFHKIKQDQLSYYYHPYFLKHSPENYHLISRKPQRKVQFQDFKLLNQQNVEPFPIKSTSKKVSFFESVPEEPKKDTEFISYFTIKFQKSKSNIFEVDEEKSECLSYHYQEDSLSLSQILKEKQKAKQFIKSSKKIIIWRDQSIGQLDQLQ